MSYISAGLFSKIQPHGLDVQEELLINGWLIWIGFHFVSVSSLIKSVTQHNYTYDNNMLKWSYMFFAFFDDLIKADLIW